MAPYRGHRGVNATGLLVMVIGLCATAWSAPYGGGTGTADDPYQIATAADLIALGETPADYGKHFILTADIDLDPNLPGGRVFNGAVIGATTDQTKYASQGIFFNGVFDGNGCTIAHLTIQGKGSVGLFATLGPRASVFHLRLEAVDIHGTGYLIGSLAGGNYGSITISCSTGTVRGSHDVGGLVGENFGSIATSYSTATVAGDFAVGGLAGGNAGKIAVTYSTGRLVTGNECVGGLVGANGGYITGSYCTGTVAGNDEVGGLVGRTDAGRTSTSFWDVETSGQSSSTGGTGLTTAEMQDINTFLNAGWDFINEDHNGTCSYWRISTGDYPRLCYGAGVEPLMPEGLGTPEQPFLIRDARDLGTVWFEPTAHHRLEASVDLSGITWSMAVIPWFDGTLDGHGCAIRNLCIRDIGYLGLFGILETEANVSDLGVDAADIQGTDMYVGGLAGTSGGTITGCRSTGVVTGGEYTGGLVGENHGSIDASQSASAVTGHCSGGLAGRNRGSITMSHTAGAVTGSGGTGGLVGDNDGAIAMSHSSATVAGGIRVGGLVGFNSHGSITTSYAAGAVTGDSSVGGLVGDNWASITASYSTGAATGHTHVGGLAGLNGGDIATSYSTGTVSGDSSTGGLVGDSGWAGSIVAQCFWDIRTSGRTTSAGGTGKTTAEMQMVTTFLAAGWDFIGETTNGVEDVWWIEEGKNYPRLWWEAAEEGSR